MINPKTLENLKAKKWYKIWAGRWSLLSLSHFADQYTDILDLEGVKFVKNCVLTFQDGASAGFITEEEKHFFAKYIADLYTAHPVKIETLIKNLKSEADSILTWIERHRAAKFDHKKYEEFWQQIDKYYVPHILNKWIVEGLAPEVLEKYLPGLQEARLHAEPVFTRTEELMEAIAKQVARETGKSFELILCLTKGEMLGYWPGGDLPADKILAERRKASAVVYAPGIRELYAGADAAAVENLLAGKQEGEVIKGVTAYPGKVQGRVKIILDPAKAGHFQAGDILVTGMTRPEYLTLMHQAAAFVTDSGGVLSHAAIVARELKKPCVIGTQVATKVLKDGDLVEVDADKGVVRVLAGVKKE